MDFLTTYLDAFFATTGQEAGWVLLTIGGLSLLFFLTSLFVMNRAVNTMERARDTKRTADIALTEVQTALKSLERQTGVRPSTVYSGAGYSNTGASAAPAMAQPALSASGGLATPTPTRRKLATTSTAKKRWAGPRPLDRHSA